MFRTVLEFLLSNTFRSERVCLQCEPSELKFPVALGNAPKTIACCPKDKKSTGGTDDIPSTVYFLLPRNTLHT